MITQIVDGLTALGFSERIAQAYVLLAQKGEISARDIGERFSLTRPTSHDVMLSLVQHGLARTKSSGKDRVYVMEPPVMIRTKLEESKRESASRLEQFNSLLPNLEMLSQMCCSSNPLIRYAEGIEEMTPMLRDFSELAGDVLQLIDNETYRVMSRNSFGKKRIRSMIIADQCLKKFDRTDMEVRSVSPSIVSAMGEMSVCGDSVLFLSHTHGARAVQITSQPIVGVCRAALELAWCAAGKIEEWMR